MDFNTIIKNKVGEFLNTLGFSIIEDSKNSVSFNPNSKFLQTRLRNERILIFDKDKVWKLLEYKYLDEQMYDTYFGKGFSKCVKTKVDNSDYLPYM